MKRKQKKYRDCTTYVAKTKALISCAVTAQLICAFVFTYAKGRFSHDTAPIYIVLAVDQLRGVFEEKCQFSVVGAHLNFPAWTILMSTHKI